MVAIDQAQESYKGHSATVVAPGASTGVREWTEELNILVWDFLTMAVAFSYSLKFPGRNFPRLASPKGC